MNPSITVTEAACEYIKKMLEKQPGADFRLSVKKTGCSGYSYVPEIVATCRPDDFSFAAANGVTIFCRQSMDGIVERCANGLCRGNQIGIKAKASGIHQSKRIQSLRLR